MENNFITNLVEEIRKKEEQKGDYWMPFKARRLNDSLKVIRYYLKKSIQNG